MKEQVFALDIGTQSVSGILLEKNDTTFRVIDYYIKHHQERSMLDGQIQNVVEVADVIKDVKEKLEEKHGPLREVCVAAAGRALKTVKTKKTISISEKPLSSQEEINHLELSTVQQAQLQLAKEGDPQYANYHCVGFSVLHYYLDSERIGSLIDQKGKEAGVEVITTFLPKVVIESLLSALDRADLKMQALTLEPIAAIHVLIPTSMRRLNVALIDIGAGTSDIAISNDGTVVAYGMVPIAGDEITEAISDHYLLDFKEAEMAKQQIVNEKKTVVQDILGFDTEITFDELSENISERVENLANLLGEEVLKLNGQMPQAVMLIGGGSLTPEINTRLANFLQLPKNRVAMRGIEGIQYLDKENQAEVPAGPEFVTPIGIAISATQNPLHYTNVYVNEHLTLMFRTKELTIGDCLIQAGMDINKYYGKIGLSYIAAVNGQSMTLRGEYGKGPTILLNGKEATVNSPIQDEDNITVVKGADGKQPHVSIRDILGEKNPITFTFNNKTHQVHPVYYVNNNAITSDYIVQDKDNITEGSTATIETFLEKTYPHLLKKEAKDFEVNVNNRKVKIQKGVRAFFLNGKQTALTAQLNEGDLLLLKEAEVVTVKMLLNDLDKEPHSTIQVTFNGESVIVSQKQLNVMRNGQKLEETSEIMHGNSIELKELPTRAFIFQDVFRFVDIDFVHKGSYQLYRNGAPVNFNDQITHSDTLEIVWDR